MRRQSEKQISGRTLRSDGCGNVDKKKLDDSRSVEWKKWLDFGPSVKTQGQVLHELLDEGHKPIPTHRIDTDKNEQLKRLGVEHKADMKSRLVGCGQFEDRTGIRSDSLTADVEGLNTVCSFAACKKLQIKF